MEYTPNYNLKKPGDQDNVLVGDLNENMDTVDATMKKLSDGKANLDPDTGKVEESELPEFLKLIGGTMKGAIDMAGFQVSNLVDPVADDHAARKAYVDAQMATKARLKTGSYVGNGSTTLNVTVGFKPAFVFVFCASKEISYSISMSNFAIYSDKSIKRTGTQTTHTQTVSVTDSGFKIVGAGYGAQYALNLTETTYVWAAFE